MSFSGCGSGKAKSEEYHVGILSGLSYLAAAIDGFKEEMTKLGYIEGENIHYTILSTESDLEEYKAFSKSL